MIGTVKRGEEKGERTRRSKDTYHSKGGVKGISYCECGAIYSNKRWSHDEQALNTLKRTSGHTMTCPACQRIHDNNPAGIVTLSGSHLRGHAEEILNLVKHVAAAVNAKNPLGKLMEITEGKETIDLTTTDDKMAQKLGKEIYKAHGGELHFHWSDDQRLVRVRWSR
jgi:NMD protein affecting ribosome stability and mRNA decay